jgi:hypothetical protein
MTSLMSSRVTRSTILTVAAACGVLVASSLPASAATKGPDRMKISCNPKWIATGVTVTTHDTGDFKIKQNSSSPREATKYWARNVNNNADLAPKRDTNGHTVTWTNVVPGKYQVKAVIASAERCNTYIARYTVTYPG